jgi:hypothetical protein
MDISEITFWCAKIRPRIHHRSIEEKLFLSRFSFLRFHTASVNRYRDFPTPAPQNVGYASISDQKIRGVSPGRRLCPADNDPAGDDAQDASRRALLSHIRRSSP